MSSPQQHAFQPMKAPSNTGSQQGQSVMYQMYQNQQYYQTPQMTKSQYYEAAMNRMQLRNPKLSSFPFQRTVPPQSFSVVRSQATPNSVPSNANMRHCFSGGQQQQARPYMIYAQTPPRQNAQSAAAQNPQQSTHSVNMQQNVNYKQYSASLNASSVSMPVTHSMTGNDARNLSLKHELLMPPVAVSRQSTTSGNSQAVQPILPAPDIYKSKPLASPSNQQAKFAPFNVTTHMPNDSNFVKYTRQDNLRAHLYSSGSGGTSSSSCETMLLEQKLPQGMAAAALPQTFHSLTEQSYVQRFPAPPQPTKSSKLSGQAVPSFETQGSPPTLPEAPLPKQNAAASGPDKMQAWMAQPALHRKALATAYFRQEGTSENRDFHYTEGTLRGLLSLDNNPDIYQKLQSILTAYCGGEAQYGLWTTECWRAISNPDLIATHAGRLSQQKSDFQSEVFLRKYIYPENLRQF